MSLESWYHISGILLTSTLIIGFFQVWLMKKEMKKRHERAAVEKGIEYMSLFASEIIPNWTQYKIRVHKMVETYNTSGDHKLKIPNLQVNTTFKDPNVIETGGHELFIEISQQAGGVQVLNQLELFSTAMTSGLADKGLTFNPLSQMFCSMVEFNYLLICYARKDADSTLYSNVITLYNDWTKQMKHNKVKRTSKELQQFELTEKQKPIGY